MPPFQPKQTMPGAGADRALGHRPAGRARRPPGPASAASTCTGAAVLSHESSHSPTTGITTSSATSGSLSIATETAPS